jgi:hypothetical protein
VNRFSGLELNCVTGFRLACIESLRLREQVELGKGISPAHLVSLQLSFLQKKALAGLGRGHQHFRRNKGIQMIGSKKFERHVHKVWLWSAARGYSADLLLAKVSLFLGIPVNGLRNTARFPILPVEIISTKK